MEIKILTVPFDKELSGFDSELIEDFILNKEVIAIDAEFFTADKPYWTFAIKYQPLEKIDKPAEEKEFNLSKAEEKLFEAIRNWRNERASEEGFPPYIIATNNQLKEIVQLQPESLAKLKTIQGIGTKKAKDYGGEILELIAKFCGDSDEG